MTHKWLGLFLLVGLALAACGQDSESRTLPPTISISDLATRDAQTAQAAAGAVTLTPTTDPLLTSAAVIPSNTATLTPSVLPPTFTSTPSAAPPTATATPEQDQAQPFTQTYAAILQATQTRQAVITLTPPTAAPTPTPEESATPAGEPAGRYEIVFYSNRNGNDDIFLLKLNGDTRALTGSAANEREPSCAPDGSAIVYASDASGRFQIYLQRLDGSEPVQLTDSEGINFAPVFSPDGQSIAFVSTRLDGVPTVWVMDADGGNQRQITTELGRDTSPSWEPDGRQLLFSAEQIDDWDIFLTIPDELEGEFPLLPPELSAGNQLWPFFDPLGERVAYTLWSDLNDPQTSDIYILDFELAEPVPVSVGEGANIAWSFAGDNQLLASVGGPDDVQLALIDLETNETILLTDAGTFNGGGRVCVVDPARLPPEPAPAPSPTPSPSPTTTPTVTPAPEESSWMPPALLAAQGHQHIVQSGENLTGIANRYGVTTTTLVSLNGLLDPDRLAVGQSLIIPVTRTGYRQSGYQLPDSNLTGQIATKKQIIVRLSRQRVYAYENGRLVRSALVSTGLPDTPTVQGEYRIYYKLYSQTMSGPGYYLPGVPYVMYFYQGYGLHGTYWHDNFGQPMSHGCVNLPTSEAKWFFEWAEIGTPVIVKP